MDTNGHDQADSARAAPSAALDGNVLAGPLSELFAVDLTIALVTCSGCGQEQALAQLVVYGDCPAMVARCPGCQQVNLRVGLVGDSVHLDLRGAAVLKTAAS